MHNNMEIAKGKIGNALTSTAKNHVVAVDIVPEKVDLINKREGESKFRSAVLAGNGDILSVAVDHILDDVKTQTPAVPVLGAGFVQLVEPVEHQRQLLRRDGLALVGDGYIGFVRAFFNGKPQRAAFRAEFHGVVQKVVHNLGHRVLAGHGKDGMLREIHVHFQVFVVDFLFKAEKSSENAFAHIKAFAVYLHFARFNF